MKLADYQSLIFDCDGVVLNSNRVKTEAFYKAALPYGREAAQALVDYHLRRGGISRYKKFEWFLREVVLDREGPGKQNLLDSYSREVRDGLLTCDVAPGIYNLRKRTGKANWLIVSGGDQQELREVFSTRDLADLFDGGVFGSPDDKSTILARELKNGNIRQKALFLGDSRYDHIAARDSAIDFLFLSRWTEFVEWREYCKRENIAVINSLQELLAE